VKGGLTVNNKAKAAAWAGVMAASTATAQLAVENVAVVYDAATKTVEVGYDLSGGNAIVTLVVETNGVAIPDRHVTRLSGDVCRLVEAGAGKRIVWDMGRDWPGNLAEIRARVEAWPENEPPLYMVLDLTKSGSATIPVTYYRSEDGLPYGGVTNDVYKTFLMAFRRVDPGVFTMGAPVGEIGRSGWRENQVEVTLTQPFYIGVYEVTHRQYNQIRNTGSPGSQYNGPLWQDTRPVGRLSYYHVRENWGNTPMSPTWPDTFDPGPNSFMGMLSARTGMDFDLPTSAQWEYACRAGTATALNILGGQNLVGSGNDPLMAQAGRYWYNGGRVMIAGVWHNAEVAYGGDLNRVPDTHGSAPVGSYPPNAWGLYDMHGNLYDYVLDWATPDEGSMPQGPLTDPKGFGYAPGADSNRVVRGGSYSSEAFSCRSAYWSYVGSRGGATYPHVGIRVVRRLGRW
jgi:formylglycine-generating enzyme required for sulfatase activity